MTEQIVPESMAAFVAAIGTSATLSVIRTFGGAPIYIPKADSLDETHPLVRLLGLPLAERIAAEFGGEQLDIPRAATAQIEVRNEEIRRRFRGGESVRQLALSFALSKRSIWYVIRTT